MAEEIAIANSGERAKLRNPLGVVGLSLITLGIYYFFWWYYINREMRDLGRARGTDLGQNPGNSVLAVTLGALIIVPAIVSMWRTSDRIQRSQEVAGIERGANGPIIFILLLLIGPVGLWYAQSELNKAWDRAGVGRAAQPSGDRAGRPGPASSASARGSDRQPRRAPGLKAPGEVGGPLEPQPLQVRRGEARLVALVAHDDQPA